MSEPGQQDYHLPGVGDRFKEMRKKVSRVSVAGYACNPDFSPEMSYLASGDGTARSLLGTEDHQAALPRRRSLDDVCIQVLASTRQARSPLRDGTGM